jgi:hypothetical protein
VIANVNEEDSENTVSDEKKMESDKSTEDSLMEEDLERTVIKFGDILKVIPVRIVIQSFQAKTRAISRTLMFHMQEKFFKLRFSQCITSSYIRDYDLYCLSGCGALQSDRISHMFQRNIDFYPTALLPFRKIFFYETK